MSWLNRRKSCMRCGRRPGKGEALIVIALPAGFRLLCHLCRQIPLPIFSGCAPKTAPGSGAGCYERPAQARSVKSGRNSPGGE